MNWSSVKNLLIAMLVAANVFILFNIAKQNRARGYIDENEVDMAVGLLNDRGLAIDADSIPLRRFDAYIYESLYGEDYFQNAAETLAGSKSANRFILPDGSFMIDTENGASFDFDNGLGFVYKENGNIPSEAYTDITAENFSGYAAQHAELDKSHLKESADSAVRFLNAGLGSESQLSVRVEGGFYDEISGYSYILVQQLLDGIPIYKHSAVCAFDGGRLIAVSGYWYFFGVESSWDEELCDQINILFTDLDTLEKRRDSGADSDKAEPLPGIVTVTACYVPYWNSDKTALYFIPAWQIEHTDETTIVYNAVTNAEYISTR